MLQQSHFTAHHVNVMKDNAENFAFFCVCSCDISSKPIPSSSSEPIDNRLPTQEGKQTSQETANTSERQI